MPREKAQAAPTARLKVPMRRRGAECPVVATKRGNARGAKGAGHCRGVWANWVKPGGARNLSGRRQPSCDDTSRMNREVHVRICERLGVKFPGPTRHGHRVRSTPESGRLAAMRKLAASGHKETKIEENPRF